MNWPGTGWWGLVFLLGYLAGRMNLVMDAVDWIMGALSERRAERTWRFYAAFPSAVVAVPLAWGDIGVRALADLARRKERSAARHRLGTVTTPADQVLLDPNGLLNEVREKRDDV